MKSAAPPFFDLSAHFAALGADLCRRVPDLGHIDPRTILFALARSRAAGTHGTYARIVPLRFAAGEPEVTRRRGRWLETYRMPAVVHSGRDILYVIHLMVPRLLRLTPEQKLETVIHELYHVSERCDGDIRRFPGRNFAHGASRRAFNRRVNAMAAFYQASRPDLSLQKCLHLSEEDWLRARVRLSGLSIALPRARLVARTRA